MEKLRIGTRGSKLALWQAEHIQSLLASRDLDSEIVKIETKGDKILDVSIAKIGSKGVFTEEIEDQLKSGNIDIAVHSAKDLQSVLPDGFEVIAFTKREQSHDVLLSHKKYINLTQNDLVLGTSSTRRLSFLKKYYPHIKTVPVRGNLQTRIRKMKDGECDALMLAYAGAHRMEYDDMIIHEFATDHFIPAVGQGSVAIEAYENLDANKSEMIRQCINHQDTEHMLIAERSFLKVMNGGCSVPVFALAKVRRNALTIEGGIISLDGEVIISSTESGEVKDRQQIGARLADYVLSNGGREILAEIKKTQAEQ